MREGSKLDIGYFFHCIVPLSLPFSGLRGTFLCWRRKPGYYISLSIYKFREERGLTKFSYIIFRRVFLLATVSGNQPKNQEQQTLQVWWHHNSSHPSSYHFYDGEYGDHDDRDDFDDFDYFDD